MQGDEVVSGAASDADVPIAVASAELNPATQELLCDTYQNLKRYAIYARRYVDLAQGSRVYGGNVGVHETTGAIPIPKRLRVGQQATVSSDRTVVASSVRLAVGSIVGAVLTNDLSSDGTFASEGGFPGDTPDLPMLADIDADEDRPRNAGASLHLTQGVYGDLTVAVNGKLYLDSDGTYVFRNIKINEGGAIISEQPNTVIAVEETIIVGKKGSIAPNKNKQSLTAKDLKVLTNLETRLIGDESEMAVVAFREESYFRGLLTAPHAFVRLGPKAKVVGALVADHFDTKKEITVTWEDGITGGACRELCIDDKIEPIVPDRAVTHGDEVVVSNDLPEGDYLINYVKGCMRYNFNYWWSVNGINGRYAWYLIGDARTDVVQLPGTQGYWPGNHPVELKGIEDFEDCQLINQAEAPIEIHHPGGFLGIRLKDGPFDDNRTGDPNPTWSVIPIADAGGCYQ